MNTRYAVTHGKQVSFVTGTSYLDARQKAEQQFGECELEEFTDAVERTVEQMYGFEDGGDLCHNLMEAGVIGDNASIEQAAMIVAQHLAQT